MANINQIAGEVEEVETASKLLPNSIKDLFPKLLERFKILNKTTQIILIVILVFLIAYVFLDKKAFNVLTDVLKIADNDPIKGASSFEDNTAQRNDPSSDNDSSSDNDPSSDK
jgi:hypothetical protein